MIGVLQLINKTDTGDRLFHFNKSDETVIKALSAQAAMAL